MDTRKALMGSMAAIGLLALSACGSRADEEPAAPAAPAAEPAATEAAATDAPAAAAPAAGADFASLTGDAKAGEKVFAVCMTCHSRKEGENKVGPSLAGIVGRKSGSVAGFAYSDANKNSGITWTEEELFTYLENPQAKIPGTKMVFPGLKDPQQRADLIAYLKS